MRLIKNLPVPAGLSNPLGISVRYIRLASSTVRIVVENFETGERNELVQGEALRFDEDAIIVLRNETVTDAVVDIEISKGVGEKLSSIVSGEVTVSGNVSTFPYVVEKEQGSFMYGLSQIGVPASGLYHGAQLYNPVGSGVTAIVTSLTTKPQANTKIWVGHDSVIYPTHIDYAYNRYAGGALSKCSIRTKTTVGGGGDVFWLEEGIADTRYKLLENGEKIVLPPGRGLNVYNLTIETGGVNNFSWYEETI